VPGGPSPAHAPLPHYPLCPPPERQMHGGRGEFESGRAMGVSARPRMRYGGGGARRESAVTWALVFGEGTLGVGWVGAHAEMRRPAPPSPSHHSHRAFPAVPEPVMEHRHGGSALGAPYRPLSPLPEGGKEGE
jgi:hypothetical protein